MKAIKFILGFIVLGFVFLLIVGMIVSRTSTGSGSSSSTADTGDRSATPPFTVTLGNRVYTGTTASNVGVAVMRVSTSPFF